MVWLRAIYALFALVPSLSLAAGLQCAPVGNGETECVAVEYRPSGPSVIKERRKAGAASPHLREMQGATSGVMLFGGVQLIFVVSKNAWVARDPNNQTVSLLTFGESLPRKILGLGDGNYQWDIIITGATMPVEISGIATEDVPKLSLQMSRK